MTHVPATVQQCLELAEQGLTAVEISHRTGVSRSTVKDWLAGRIPLACRPGRLGCPTCGTAQHRFSELPTRYAHLLGLYLGDGCLSPHPRGVYKLRLALDAAYPAIVDEAAAVVSLVMPRSKVNRRVTLSNNYEVYSYSKAWPCLLPQHGPGKKHTRAIVLHPWQQELVARAPHLLLRGLLQSDGCRFMNTGKRWRHPRYVFCNYSADIRRIFCDACDQVGLHWTPSRNVIYVSRKRDVATLDCLVGAKC